MRCRAYVVLAALLVASLAPIAAAQSFSVRLTVAPASVEAAPGSPALFEVEVANDGLLTATVDLGVENLSAGWSYNLSKTQVALEPGATERVFLTAFTPETAAPGTNGTLVVTATREGTDIDAAPPVRVRVDVVEPAPRESESAPPAPKLAVFVADASAYADTEARGTLTVYNGDARDVTVGIAVTGDTLWSPRVVSLPKFVLHPDETRTVSLAAFVPAGTAADAFRAFDVAVSNDVDASVLHHAWRVESLGAQPGAAEEPAPEETGESESDAGTEASSTEATAADAPERTFAVRVAESLVYVPAGASTRATLLALNPGEDPITIRFTGDAPDGWTLQFEADAVHLLGGASRQLWVNVLAPADAIPGGRGEAAIVASVAGAPEQRVPFLVEPQAPRTSLLEGAASAATADDGDATLARPETSGAAIGLALGAGAVGAGALVLTRRRWRESLLWGGVGLYTRLLRPDILRHEEREKLHEMIQAQPGVHFHALQRQLDWNTGTLTYHLRVLERHSFITSRRDGLLRRFYVVGTAPRQETFEGPTGLRADVLEAVRNQAGISQSDLALALGANKQTVNYHVKALERQGLLRIEKRGRDTYLFAGADAAAASAEGASA